MRTICPFNIQGHDIDEYLYSQEIAFENMTNILKGGKKGAHLICWWNIEGKWSVSSQLVSLLTKGDEKYFSMECNNC